MKDSRMDVPLWAFINAQIIQRANEVGDLDNAIRDVEKQYKVNPHTFKTMNAAYVISLLYCLILIPKELWLKSRDDHVFKKIGDPTAFAQITLIDKNVDKDFDRCPAFYFIKHLRNALAHVRFSINNNSDFLFWDQKNENSPHCFEAKMSIDQMKDFLSNVGGKLANLRNRPDTAQD